MKKNNITIHQGKGDDELEMTVQVSRREWNKMKKIQEQNPSLWERKEFDLLKEAKRQLKVNRIIGNVGFGVIATILIIAMIIINNQTKSINKMNAENIQGIPAAEAQKRQMQYNYSNNLEKIYKKSVPLGFGGSYEDFSRFFYESETNRQCIYHKNVENGYAGSYKDFLEYAGYIITENTNVTDLYNILLGKGAFNGSHQDFLQWLNISENRLNLYNKLVEKGAVTGSIKEFESWLGLGMIRDQSSCVNLDKIKQPPIQPTNTVSKINDHKSQNNKVQGTPWPTYSFPNVCSISIPPTMELRDDNSSMGKLFSTISPSLYKLICDGDDLFSNHSRIVFQPKGMNSDNLKDIDIATATYARIIIEFGNNYDVGQEDVKSMTSADFVKYDEIVGGQFKSEFDYAQQALGRTGTFVWHPTKREKIGGKYCLVLDYDRSGLQGMVKVKKYIFYYNSKEIDVTLSYRTNEKKKYENDFNKVINSLKIE